MRKLPSLWRGVERIQYLCVFLESIGLDSLRSVPLITSGFQSLLGTDLLNGHAQELFNLRMMGLDYTSEATIRRQVALYNEKVDDLLSKTDSVFEIDTGTLRFSRHDNLIDEQVEQAIEILKSPLSYQEHAQDYAEPGKNALVPITPDRESQHVEIHSPPLPHNKPGQHDLNRTITNDIEVPITELIRIAADMDRMDYEDSTRENNNWQNRLNSFMLCLTKNAELPEARTLHLKDVRHMIGLPGSGKTTLLTCLAVYLAQKKIKTLLLFPKIETGLTYLDHLRFYGVSVSLLSGQSNQSRDRHSDRISETIAAKDPDGSGFGLNIPGSEYFGKTCALAGFAVAQEEVNLLPYGYAPCEKIHQTNARHKSGKYKNLLCSGWYSCGRNKASRDLIRADVWIGHIASATSAVPAHAIAERIRYLELIAASFDVVIIDEADDAQKSLDDMSVSEITLSGDPDSFHNVVNEFGVKRVAGYGRQHIDESPEFSEKTHAFSIFTNRLFGAISKLSDNIIQEKRNVLLTTLNLIADIIREARGQNEPDDDPCFLTEIEKINTFWVSVIGQAVFDNDELEEVLEEQGISTVGSGIVPDLPNLSSEQAENLYNKLRLLAISALKPSRNIEKNLEQINEVFLKYVFDKKSVSNRAVGLGRLLINVSFSIFAYKALKPILKEMVALEHIPAEVVHTHPPLDILRLSSANIVGALSGVRFEILETSPVKREMTIRISQLAFDSAPRTLLYRLHNLLTRDGKKAGPAVLVTSATSFLKPAPAYHIDIGPDYLLRPRKHEDKAERDKTIYTFLPAYDHHRPRATPIRISGAPGGSHRRDENLKRLADHILKDGEDSYVMRYMQEFDAKPHPRKVGLVVNSYQQVRVIKQYIRERYPEVSRQTLAVINHIPEDGNRHEWITSAQVEHEFADNPQFNILVFPLRAIGRGTNIVFKEGPRIREAAIGQLYFLTRPHPTGDDLSLLVSLAGAASQKFDSRIFPKDASMDDLLEVWRNARRETYQDVSKLLNNPLMASRLGKLIEPFVANNSVDIVQAIGRAMRGGVPCRVFFTDAAWAPRSAERQKDTESSSMLIQMRMILHHAIHDSNPVHAEIARELYQEFYEPLCRVEGLYDGTQGDYEDE